MSVSESDGIISGSEDDGVVIGRDDVSNYNPEHILPQDPETIEEIRAWLQPTSYNIVGSEYRKHMSAHVPGTGVWLTSSGTYQDWLQKADHGLLWIKGIPGSGKSVMAANLVKELTETNPGVPVLYFFFRQIIEANHKPEALLHDWMDQVLDYSPPLQKQLKKHIDAGRTIVSISMEDMWKDLRMAFASLPGKIFCVADALDEMDQGYDHFLQALGELGRWRPAQVKLLITSRMVPRVETPLENIPCLQIRLHENMVDADISSFIRSALSASQIPPSDWDAVTNAVPGRANGQFLYARLAMDAFLEPGVNVKTVLSKLPADLNVLYSELLKEHAQRSTVPSKIQDTILQVVTHASRPIRLLELAEMIAFSGDDDDPCDLKTAKSLVRRACGPLLEILPDETVSVIHHSFTEYLLGTTRTRDSMETGYRVFRPGPAHAGIAMVCLRYLTSGCLETVKLEDDLKDVIADNRYNIRGTRDPKGRRIYTRNVHDAEEERIQRRLQYPLFEYAVSNWYHHINKSETAGHDQSTINSVLRGFLGDEQARRAWLQFRWPRQHGDDKRTLQIHIACRTGLLSYTKELLEHTEADVKDGGGRTPLWWAATRGHAGIIRELLAVGADPNPREQNSEQTALHKAAVENHHEVVTLLLAAGVDPMATIGMGAALSSRGDFHGTSGPSTKGHTALIYAADGGHLETVEAFLPFLKDINHVHLALAWAASKGWSKVVSRILQHPGVNVNHKIRGDTPLYHACSCLSTATVCVLLRAGADPNAKNKGRTYEDFYEAGSWMLAGPEPKESCLHELCRHKGDSYTERVGSPPKDEDLQDILTLLLEAGADVQQRNKYGKSPLHLAAGNSTLTRRLLRAGADANAVTDGGSSPLHNVESVDSLVSLVEEGNADMELVNFQGNTPLLSMISKDTRLSCNAEVILKFLEYGPNCKVINRDGDGPLHLALAMRRSAPKAELISALLARGADPDLRNKEGASPLHYVHYYSRSATMEIATMLLDAGADINAQEKASGSTLFTSTLGRSGWMVSEEERKHLEWLRHRGASIEARDSEGRTLLHRAIGANQLAGDAYSRSRLVAHVNKFDFLVSLGHRIDVVDDLGNTLVHQLALSYRNHAAEQIEQIMPFWEKLVRIGLDLEQRNHAGQTPLHTLCATDSGFMEAKPGQITAVDFVLSRTADIDPADNDGLTPLHLAVRGRELYIKKLLDAGANILATNKRGMTPLHIAAQHGDSNVVGLLLEALKQRGQTASTSDDAPGATSSRTLSQRRSQGVNSATSMKWRGYPIDVTPLYFACQSGRPETVKLLLEAGADPDIGDVFHACITYTNRENDFSMREYLTNKAVQSNKDLWARLAGSDLNRIEEILDMLIEYGAGTSRLNDLLVMATREQKHHTAQCFRKILRRSPGNTRTEDAPGRTRPKSIDEHTAGPDPLGDFQRDYAQAKSADGDQHKIHRYFLRRYLIQNQPSVVMELARQGVDFFPSPDTDEPSYFTILVRLGLATMVDCIGTEYGKDEFGNAGLRFPRIVETYPPDSSRRPKSRTPYLVEATARKFSNMEVVRLLVEKFQVDIDELDWVEVTKLPKDRLSRLGPRDAADSALHAAARAKYWWQVYQALPYLIKAGANLNLLDHGGNTALHIALQGRSTYRKEVVRILVDAGADVNAINGQGQSCLALASHEADLTALLRSHGAVVTFDTAFAAITAKDVDALRSMLAGGLDPDVKCASSPHAKDVGATRKGLPKIEIKSNAVRYEVREATPLFYAAKDLKPSAPSSKAPQAIRGGVVYELVQVLLDHGADVFSEILVRDENRRSPTDILLECRSVTLLHELVRLGLLVEMFLDLPALDVNRRDASGLTLLHMACQSQRGPDSITGWQQPDAENTEFTTLFRRLLSLGADVHATDNAGRNVLHVMIEESTHGGPFEFMRSLLEAIRMAPDLLNKSDNSGKSPLHYAVTAATFRKDAMVAELLLAEGADAFAITPQGDTCLHLLFAQVLSPELHVLFQRLITKGVDINQRNEQGQTPLFIFYGRWVEQNVFFGLLNNDEPQRTVDFTERGLVRLLQEAKADFFARDNKGRGLLHVAARGPVENFKELLDLGLDVGVEDDGHQTAIDIASACGNTDVLELFEKTKSTGLVKTGVTRYDK